MTRCQCDFVEINLVFATSYKRAALCLPWDIDDKRTGKPTGENRLCISCNMVHIGTKVWLNTSAMVM